MPAKYFRQCSVYLSNVLFRFDLPPFDFTVEGVTSISCDTHKVIMVVIKRLTFFKVFCIVLVLPHLVVIITLKTKPYQ